MAAQQQGGQGNSTEDLMTMALVAILLVLGAWLLWSKLHTEIVTASVMIRSALLWPFAFFSDNAAFMIERLRALDPDSMTFAGYQTMMGDTGRYVRWIFVPIIMAFGVFIYLKAYTTKFCRTHSIQSLVRQEKAIWPEISPVVDLDLIGSDPFKGGWAVSMNEREFAKLHKLTNDEGVLDRDKTAAVFASQLGARWRGVENLPPHAKAIFALFAIRINGGQAESLDRARQLAISYAETKDVRKMDFSWVDEAIKVHGNNELVQKAISRHAWVYTVLCTMLQVARMDGVFASPLWIWLRPVDRKLFYALNCVGRYAYFVEVGGILAQWRAEKKLGVPIGFPDVTAAVDGLDKALKDFCDDDALEKIFE